MRATAHVATLGAAARTMQFCRLGRPEAILRPFFVAAAAQATRPETIRITAKTQSRRPQRKYNKITCTNASGKCVFFLVSYQKFLISDRYIFSSIPALIFPRSIKGANSGSSTPQNENMLRTKISHGGSLLGRTAGRATLQRSQNWESHITFTNDSQIHNQSTYKHHDQRQ